MKKAFFVLKRFAYVLLCAILLAGQFSPLYVSADTGTGEQETESRVSTTRLEELARAVKLGFGNNIDSTEEITYAEYIEMLDKLVVLIYPDDAAKLQQWQSMYPEARICYDKLERSNAMYLLYAVAHDILGEKYCRDPQRVGRYTNWGELNAYMGEVWDEYSTNIELFDDTAVQEQIAGANFTSSRHANAYFNPGKYLFCQNGKVLAKRRCKIVRFGT